MTNRDGREALRGAEEETFDLLAEVCTPDEWAELLRAPLERVARLGNRGLAQKLVRAGAEIGDALHEAARGGHGELAGDLLENGAPVDAKDTSRDGYFTPLHVAAIEGETELVQLLLLKGADKDALDDNKGFTPVYLAALNGRVAATLALMAAGADVTLQYGYYDRSLAHLAVCGHVDVLRAAIQRGADVDAVDSDQSTPLHVAVKFDRMEAIKVILEAGASVEVRDGNGWTPLHYAADEPSHEAVLALLKYGADVNAPNKVSQDTPLHWAARNARGQGAVEVVDSLLRSGADETILNDRGQAAVDVVAEYVAEEDQLGGDIERVRELLANAPADRAWRRRGYLVLCRTHPDRVQQVRESSSARAGVTRTSRSRAKLARSEAGSRAGRAEVCTGGDGAVVIARVLGVQEEGIFRTIVGYL